MPTTATKVQSPLNLFLPIEPGKAEALRQLIATVKGRDPDPVDGALKGLANVHTAQFVVLPDVNLLAVLTVYDGDFDDYILSFVDAIGFVFDNILPFIVGGSDVIPVRQRSARFVEFLRQHDRRSAGLFTAYQGRVFDIRDALASHAAKSRPVTAANAAIAAGRV